jgi:hypothetical protein
MDGVDRAMEQDSGGIERILTALRHQDSRFIKNKKLFLRMNPMHHLFTFRSYIS